MNPRTTARRRFTARGLGISYLPTSIFGTDLKAAYSSVFSTMYEESTGPGGTLVSDSSPMGWVEDLSGNGQHFSQATTANKATYYASNAAFGNRPVWSFDSGDYYRRGFGTTYTQPNTIFLLYKLNATGALSFLFDGDDVINRNTFYQTASSLYRMFAGSNVSSGSPPDTAVHSSICVFNGASSIARLDGVQIMTGNTGANSLDGLVVGADFSGASGSNYICAELALVNRIATVGEINQVLAWYQTIYGASYTPVT
jgi:hypothetical protein